MSKYIREFNQTELNALIADEQACVKLHKSVLSLALYPYHLSDISSSIKELLNAKFASYEKKLDGLFIGYKNVRMLTPQGSLVTDSYYIHLKIEADFYIFQPKIDSIFWGIVNRISEDHVGCLVHHVFNISVPNIGSKPDWLGFDVDIEDHVLLRVEHIDMDNRLPYIRATLISIKSKEENTDSKSDISKNVDINISGITEIESTPIEKKKKKSKKHSLDQINSVDKDPSLNTTTQSTNNEITIDKKIKKSTKIRKLAETNDNLDMNPSLNGTQEILNHDSSIERKHKKIKKSLNIIDNFDQNTNFKSDALNNKTPKENKSKKSRKSFETNNTLVKDLILTATTEILNQETSTEKKRKKSKKSVERIENVNNNESSHSTSQIINYETEKKEKKSRKSSETNNYVDKNQNLSSASQILNNDIPVKKSRKSIASLNNVKNLNLSSTSEILNGETPKDKKSKKSRKSLITNDNYDNNLSINSVNIMNESTPKNEINHNENSLNFNLSSEQKSSKKNKKHKDKSELLTNTNKVNELYQVDNYKEVDDNDVLRNSLLAEQFATIQTETFEIPKQRKKSIKRNSKTHLGSEIAADDKSQKTDQQNLWDTIVLQMYDSELERTLDNSPIKSQQSNNTNDSIGNTETPQSSKRKHSISDLEDSGHKKKKRKHSISEFQDTDESPKKKHKSKKVKIKE